VRSFAPPAAAQQGHRRFQKALDACVAAGGGEVLIPAGNYLIGSVTMGSNTTFAL